MKDDARACPGLDPGTAALAAARRLLGGVRAAFDAGTLALGRQCLSNGRLDGRKLDQQQVASFELAWAGADLLASETALAAVADDAPAIEGALALLFAADAVASVLDKLETVYLEAGLDLAALRQLRAGTDWDLLRAAGSGARALEAAGRAVAASDGELGPVALDEQHALAQDAFRRFAADVVAPQAEAIHRHDRTVPESLLQPLREMGVFGLAIPERFGGSSPNDREDTLLMVVVTEALSEGSLAAAGSLITRPEILSRALMAGGTEAQKASWLPRLAAGDPLCAIAITEPDYGSDVAGLALRGTKVEGGWRLTGAKTWCTFAGKAGVLMVVTRTHPDRSLGHKGLSLLLVEKPSFDTHEFSVEQEGGGRLTGRAIPTIGYRGMHSFDLSFEDFFVPDANVVGGEAGLGQGFYLTMAGMVGGRMQTAARACGVMRAALRAAIRYGHDRKVFGSPLVDFPLTQAKLARMGARLAACRRLAYRVAGLIDAGQGRMEASLVKLLACRSAEMVTREALQLHGGMGYAEETPVSRYFVDARVLSIFEGAEETLALKVVARGLMERALGLAGAGA
ncbi:MULTISPECIES: acyl-CoA dehydrogenase family protein [Ramlibacter]|uniref:Acyl-CoA dehydrogenase n=1 Tax=Ramlibacter pinisoli TaxID=2682844 RepID=A0A6N8J1S2_9BURK|nr:MULTISPECIES: acyl-CoA dehydrogenase [Ramlibacter]MBA2962301.1 acyl-CoA dehydrogenase [Ramlibacter sp. CGMCC 1.13660]MVQ32243.1 acyl-CoA dehydrogenase [Ramlibacter pinisoli]